MSRFSKDDWAQLSPLIDEALSLPPEARTEWLRRHKVSHPTLAGELEALLNRESALEAEGFLATGTAPEMPPMSGLIGQRLGAYTIEAELGRGGMGSVWLARRTDGLFEGHAAVKFLSLAVAGPTGEARFRQEGNVLARLAHPNISRLLDAGVTPTGQPYLMLEYVDGRQLDVWCDTQRLGTEARIRLFMQVMAAVGHAHASLVVHRDIKPSNILVTSDGTVKLLDFGIARLLETGGTGGSLTGTRDAVFTYQYAAPEQITGDPISTATDVYSLGVVLYELLTGKHPTGEGAQSPADHLRATVDTDPTPLSQVNRELAGDLDNILAKSLRKEPTQRYTTVSAFADDLQRYLNHEPVTARATTWGYRAGKFVRRHRGSVSTAVLTVILLIAAAIITTLQAREARVQRDVALDQVRRVFAQSAVQDIFVADDRGADGRQLTFEEKMARAIRRLKTDFKDRPWLVVEGMISLAMRYGQETVDKHQQLLADAKEVAREGGAWQQFAAASCQRTGGWVYIPQLDSARKDLAEGKAALLKERGHLDLENRLLCIKAESELLSTEGKFDSAIAVAAQGVELTAPADNGEEVSVKTNRFVMTTTYARVLREAGRVREANLMLLQVIREMEASGYGTSTELDVVVSNLNPGLHLLGEHAVTDSALTAVVKHLEDENGVGAIPNTIRFLSGVVKMRLGLLDSAEPIMLKALQDTTLGQGGIFWWVAPQMSQLRIDQGRLAEAEPFIARIPIASNVSQLNLDLFRIRVRYGRGDRAGAAAELEQKLKEWQKDPSVRFTIPIPFAFAGEWRLAAGDARGADSVARLLLESARIDSLSATRSSFVGRGELLLARALAAQQRLPEAREAVERAVIATTHGYGAGRPMNLAAIALRDSLKGR